MINLPAGSENDFNISDVKLLLKSMPTPALELERRLKRAEYPHSVDQRVSLSLVESTSCKKRLHSSSFSTIERFHAFSWYQRDPSHSENKLLSHP